MTADVHAQLIDERIQYFEVQGEDGETWVPRDWTYYKMSAWFAQCIGKLIDPPMFTSLDVAQAFAVEASKKKRTRLRIVSVYRSQTQSPVGIYDGSDK